jgi:HD-GYP domain-containing protein (c-di-GMP phosphodiesterase class II)
VACGIWLVAAAALWLDALAVIRRPVADALLRLAAGHPPTPVHGLPDVAIVALDARSLRAFGDTWPWPRSRHAELVRRLDAAGASAIGFDISFASEQDPAGDRALGEALRLSERVVLAGHRQFQELPGLGELEVMSFPLESLARASAGVGVALADIDGDGVIRRAFAAREVGGTVRPSLAEATLTVALRHPPDRTPGSSFLIDYRRAQPEIPVISAVDVLENRFDSEEVRGRIVLVGATAAEFQDLWPTPLGPSRAGVWIQAVAIRTLAARRAGHSALAQLPLPAELCLLLILSLGAGLLAGAPHARRLVTLGALALLAPGAALVCLARFGLLVDPVGPLGVSGLHYVLGLEGVRRHLGQRLRERERSLATLFEIGHATSTGASSGGLELALVHLAEVVGASGVALLRTAPTGELDPARLEWSREARRNIGDFDTALLALSDRQLRVFEGGVPGADRPGGQAVYAPLVAGSNPAGVLVVERDAAQPLSEMQLRTIVTVGTQLALSVENLRLLEELRGTFMATIESLATAVEARDGYTELHCRRLAAFSALMADRLGLPPGEVEAIRVGALLHDVGKLGIRDSVLLKNDRLSPEERRHIEDHPEIGHRIVNGIVGLAPTTLGCVRHHHERWDGTGYPDGLAREDIPLGARIVAIVDVWDALSTMRPYKTAFPQARVREILQKDSGARFEPALVDLFLELLDECGEEMIDAIERSVSGGRGARR